MTTKEKMNVRLYFNISSLFLQSQRNTRNYMFIASSLQSLLEFKRNTWWSCQSRGPRPPVSTPMIKAKLKTTKERYNRERKHHNVRKTSGIVIPPERPSLSYLTWAKAIPFTVLIPPHAGENFTKSLNTRMQWGSEKVQTKVEARLKWH